MSRMPRWLRTSSAQPAPKLSQASTSTPRAPSSDQSAISTAPVSEAGTTASRQSSGMPSSRRLLSTTAASFSLPGAERWERPTSAPASTAGVHPGRLVQGPEEKLGFAGRTVGFIAARTVWRTRAG